MAHETPPAHEFQRITPGEEEEVYALIHESAQELLEKYGVSPWLQFTREHFAATVRNKKVWVLRADGALAGTCTTEVQNERFGEKMLWKNPDERALYPSKMAVSPQMRGKGVVPRCFQWFDEQARVEGCTVVRFLAVTAHTRIVKMYEARYGEKRGTQPCTLDGFETSIELTFFERTPEWVR
jgi:GNAT superfamily N-acetyltransferase